MTRSLKIYQGEDLSPVTDLTDPTSPVHVIWEEIEAGHRAYQLESSQSSFPMRDERGETGSSANLPSGLTSVSLAAHNRIEWLEGSNVMFRGRVGPKDYSRGRQKSDRSREVTVSANDINFDLRGIIVDGWTRPEETDVARVQALVTDYLSGSPRVTTNISTTYVSSSNTVTLPALRYDSTNPAEILSGIASIANKLAFVTVDSELFYDGHDSSAYQAGIRISDRIEELNPDGGCSTQDPDVLYGPLDFDATGSYTIADAYGGSDTWPRDPLNWSSSNPAGHNGGKCVVWGGIFVDDGSYSPRLPVTAGATYRWSAWAYAQGTAATFDLLSVGFYDVGNNLISSHGLAQGVPKGSWQGPYSDDFTAPSGAVYMVLLTGGWGDNTSHAYDDVTVSGPLGGESGAATFPPIWDVGPSSTEDGMQLLSGLRLYYGPDADQYVYVNDPVTANSYAHYEESLFTSDPAITTASAATTLAQSILRRRKFEERTYNVSIGPLNEDQVGCLKPGQLIQIKARAIPDADDAFVSRRIAQLRWTTPVPGMFFAHMMLDRPMKEVGYGVGNKAGHQAIGQHALQGSNSHPEFVPRALLTTQGDLPYRGASDWTRLAIGASNTWLKSIGTVPVWAALPSTSGGIAVEEDGASEGTGITTLNFSTNLNVSVSGSEATITADSGGGGGLTQAYAGYNTVGGSTENMSSQRVYAKKITLANACLITDIEAYIDWGNGDDQVRAYNVALFSDNSGTPQYLLQTAGGVSVLLDSTAGGGGHTNPRWFGAALGQWCAAGDYWIAFQLSTGAAGRLYYDGSGSDRYYTSGGAWISDWGWYAPTTTSNQYSIRANTVR